MNITKIFLFEHFIAKTPGVKKNIWVFLGGQQVWTDCHQKQPFIGVPQEKAKIFKGALYYFVLQGQD